MSILGPRLLCLLLLVSLLPAGGTARAEDARPRDVVVLLDNSGSMRKADPERRVRAAVREFAGRIGPQDRLALLLFDHRVRVAAGFGDTGSDAARALRKPLEQLDYRGRLTDMASAIERALAELEQHARPEAERAVVFLTDGIVDTGDVARDAESTRRLREQLAPEAARLGVRIHALAFTPQADAALLEVLTEATGAAFVRADSARELSAAFARLNAALATPAATPAPVAAAPATAGTEPTTGSEAAPAAEPSTAAAPAAAVPAGPEAEGAVPSGDPVLLELTERLGVSPEELLAVLETTQLAPPDLLELVAKGELTLAELRGMGAGQASPEPPVEADAATAAATAPASGVDPALARLAERIGGPPAEAEQLVAATRLPAEDLLALLDEAGLSLEELQGLATADAVVTRPGEGVMPVASPAAVADGAAPADPGAQALTGTAGPATPPAAPATEPGRPVPAWVIWTTLGGIVLIALGALLAVRPRAGRAPATAEAPAAGVAAAAGGPAAAVPATPAPAPLVPPEAWLSDPQRHSGQERVPLGTRPLAIGRVAGTETDRMDHLVLGQPTIGRRHAIIEFRDFAWFVSDLGSVNGTFVNGQRLGGQPQRLRAGDRIRFHRYEFGFVQPQAAEDHEATLAAQLPGEATLVADRTLAATGAPAAATVVVSRAASGEPAPSATAAPAPAEGPPGSLDTGGGLAASGDLTEPRFNPGAQAFEEEAGLDLFMASQMFAATSRPAEELLGGEASAAESDGSTLRLTSSPLVVDLPLEGGTEAEDDTDTGTFRPLATWPRHEEVPPAPVASAWPPARGEPLPLAETGLEVAGSEAFDDNFFAVTQDRPRPPPLPGQPETSGTRPPADVYFPTTPAVGGPGERTPALVSAPDHPPLAAEDDLFASDPHPLGPASRPADPPAPAPAPAVSSEEADALFATVFRAAPEPAATPAPAAPAAPEPPPAAPSGPARGAPAGGAGADEDLDAFFGDDERR